jgi:hypothetical protein
MKSPAIKMKLGLLPIFLSATAKLTSALAAPVIDSPRVNFLFLALDRIQRLDVWNRFFHDAPVDQYRLIFHCKDPVACKAQLKMAGIMDDTLGKQIEVIDDPAPSAYCTDLVSAENKLLDVALQPPFATAGSPSPAKASSFVDTKLHDGRSPAPSPQSFLSRQQHSSKSTLNMTGHPHDKFVFVSDSTIPVKSFSHVHWSLTTEADSHFCIFPREQWATSNRSPCIDDDNRCPTWSQKGECERNPNYMHYRCQRSCKVCNDDLGKLSGTTTFNEQIVAVKTHQWKVLNRADAIKSVQLWKQGFLRHLMHMMHLNWHDSFRNHGCLDEFWHFAALYGAFPSHCMGKRNAHPRCNEWALQGECGRNPVYMWKECEAACAKCQLPSSKFSGGSTFSLSLENGAEVQGRCDTFVKWPTPSAMGRNNGMVQLDHQLSGLVTMQGGNVARPETISEISPWGLVTLQKSSFLFVRKFTSNSQISGDCTPMADIFTRDVLLEKDDVPSAWAGQGVWQVDEVNHVVLMNDPETPHGFIVHNENMPLWSGKGTHCGKRISVTFKNRQVWNGQVDTSNGDFMTFDNGITWCRDMPWRGDGSWLNTYNMSVKIRTRCWHKVTITDGNPDWSGKGKLDQMLGETVVASFNKVVNKKHVKLTATISADGQELNWHNGQTWRRDEKHWAPCACTPDGALWKQPRRPQYPPKAKPKCFFLDLGPDYAHRDLDQFLVGYYDIGRFQPQDCEVIVMDPDPKKAAYLERQKSIYSNSFPMTAMSRTTAYSCEPHPSQGIEFSEGIRLADGSSLPSLHPSGSGGTKIRLVNIQRLLRERAQPQDHVVLRMDLGGLERDIISCLARSSAARLVDVMYLKKYGEDVSPLGVTDDEMTHSLKLLKQSGVKVIDVSDQKGVPNGPAYRPGSSIPSKDPAYISDFG